MRRSENGQRGLRKVVAQTGELTEGLAEPHASCEPTAKPTEREVGSRSERGEVER